VRLIVNDFIIVFNSDKTVNLSFGQESQYSIVSTINFLYRYFFENQNTVFSEVYRFSLRT